MPENQSNDWIIVAIPIGVAVVLFAFISIFLELIAGLVLTGVLFLFYTLAAKKVQGWKVRLARRRTAAHIRKLLKPYNKR